MVDITVTLTPDQVAFAKGALADNITDADALEQLNTAATAAVHQLIWQWKVDKRRTQAQGVRQTDRAEFDTSFSSEVAPEELV